MVDSTEFRTGGNENAASHSERRSRGYDMPNIRLLKKAANEAAVNYHFIRGGWDDPNCARPTRAF